MIACHFSVINVAIIILFIQRPPSVMDGWQDVVRGIMEILRRLILIHDSLKCRDNLN